MKLDQVRMLESRYQDLNSLLHLDQNEVTLVLILTVKMLRGRKGWFLYLSRIAFVMKTGLAAKRKKVIDDAL